MVLYIPIDTQFSMQFTINLQTALCIHDMLYNLIKNMNNNNQYGLFLCKQSRFVLLDYLYKINNKSYKKEQKVTFLCNIAHVRVFQCKFCFKFFVATTH